MQLPLLLGSHQFLQVTPLAREASSQVVSSESEKSWRTKQKTTTTVMMEEENDPFMDFSFLPGSDARWVTSLNHSHSSGLARVTGHGGQAPKLPGA